ncbi:glutathione S-transferase [Vannielia litorea]|uniref:glutathione S-transferase n=1 Tax=Vannielia litorea TaxID=1217970 RepID=UPI001C975C96|nr:glutathione S-transferase [Vannielia litorea]MBY6155077.1 glutathione S-transferase [Vannielia litorea]
MPYILHHSPASPFVRMVMVVAHEVGLADEIDCVEAVGTPLEPGTMPVAQNPLGKIPTLERPDGPAMFDSRVICRFLDTQGSGTLYPESRIWEVLTLEALAHGFTEAILAMTYEGRLRPEAMQSAEIMEAQWGKAQRAATHANARWMSHLSGPLDVAQIALACGLGYADFRHPHRDWRAGNEALAEWYARFCERPSMQATRPPEA